MNSYPTVRTTQATPGTQNLKSVTTRRKIWQVRYDENRRRWNKRAKNYRSILLATS